MGEEINTNVFDTNKEIVNLSNLEYFWSRAKSYIDNADEVLYLKTIANEDEITKLWTDVNMLLESIDSVGTQIDSKIDALNLPNNYDAKGDAAKAEAASKQYADGLFNSFTLANISDIDAIFTM